MFAADPYAAPRRCLIHSREQRRWASMRPRATLSSRRCPGAFRAAPHRVGGAHKAARRPRCTDRAACRAELCTPCSRAHAAVRAGAGALPGSARVTCLGRPLDARVRARGVRCYLRSGVLDHGFLRKAPRDDLGATPQARVWHRRDHLHLLQRHGADNRQHRGAHSHPANPRPLRKTRRAGASALPAGSARTARCGGVTPRRPHSPRRDRNPPRKVFEFPIRNANDWLTWEILRVQAFQRFTAERATPFSELTKR